MRKKTVLIAGTGHLAYRLKAKLNENKYAIVLKPQTYEFGFRIENIFVSVAKELKLRGLPQEILQLGEDPDAQPAIPQNKLKPKAN